MQRICGVAVAVLLGGSVTVAEPLWTETFDTGVGRFNTTTGDGHIVFAHDPLNQNLNATFFRQDSNSNFTPNRRLADLGATFTESDTVSFSFDWTPLSSNDLFLTAILGFFDESNQLVMGTRISKGENNGTADYRITGPWGQVRTSHWEFGQTYRVEFFIDGPGETFGFATSVLQGNDFVSQDFGEWPLPNPINCSFGQVGMQNLLDGEFGGSLIINIDNFSFIGPPIDSDGDGVPDSKDNCPNDPDKVAPGLCGCGNTDADTDGDGLLDCVDRCQNDPNKTNPEACGCGTSDIDSDDDGSPDCFDHCPNDPDKLDPGICGCGTPDSLEDTDGDGVIDCLDNCPNVENPDQADLDGDGRGDACELPPGSEPVFPDGCGSGACGNGGMMMPLTLLGFGWIRRRRRHRHARPDSTPGWAAIHEQWT